MTYLETGVYRLTTLSPIHIRAGESEGYGQGFIRLNNTDNCLYVVDTPKLQSEIFAHKGLEAVKAYTEEFSNPNSKTKIVDVLDKIDYDYKSNIEKISKGIVRIPSGNRFMQSGLGQHFVPGSSIKGAIKTAVLYDDVKRRDLNSFVENQITLYQRKHGIRNKRKFRESFAENLIENAFQSKHPQEHHRNSRRKSERKGPFTDIFKAIKVKDAIIEETSIDRSRFAETITTPGLDGATLRTLKGGEVHLPLNNIRGSLTKGDWVKINSVEEKDGAQTVATYTKVDEPTLSKMQFDEIILTTLKGNQIVEKRVGDNTRFECFFGEVTVEISIDHGILKSFTKAGAKLPFSDVKSLIQCCQNFAQAQWEAEQQFFEKYGSGENLNLDAIKQFYADDKDYKNEKRATLRVGWGTGMLGTTVSLVLDESVCVELRNKVISADGRNRSKPAPKSRRFVSENGQPAYPLGWIELTEK
ncbi:MAG: type III-A CRISPR-associated RAMP protein Csm5 [Candidatus Poribacteria bacterium]|nr:type III-A CRISPR-associated RAMP protein Csm5 [Candidatus Poribacteria bacterium]